MRQSQEKTAVVPGELAGDADIDQAIGPISTRGACARCKRPVWVGREAVSGAANHEGVKRVLFACPSCYLLLPFSKATHVLNEDREFCEAMREVYEAREKGGGA